MSVACRYRLQPEVAILQPVVGPKADALAAACPGLFTVEGSGASRRAVAGDARQHEKQLEKVRQTQSRMHCFSPVIITVDSAVGDGIKCNHLLAGLRCSNFLSACQMLVRLQDRMGYSGGTSVRVELYLIPTSDHTCQIVRHSDLNAL